MKLSSTSYYLSKVEEPDRLDYPLTDRQSLLLQYLTCIAKEGSAEFNRYKLVDMLSDIYHADSYQDPLYEIELDLTLLARLGKITWSSVLTKGHCWDCVWINGEVS